MLSLRLQDKVFGLRVMLFILLVDQGMRYKMLCQMLDDIR